MQMQSDSARTANAVSPKPIDVAASGLCQAAAVPPGPLKIIDSACADSPRACRRQAHVDIHERCAAC